MDFGVSDLRENVSGGGVLTIQDYTTEPADNAGFINIHDSVIKNLKSTLDTPDQILTAVHCPQTCRAMLAITSSTLAISLPADAPELTDVSVRTIEPLYPSENFINSPLLAINSHKHMLTKLSTDAPNAPTKWSGTNLYDVRYVMI